MDLASCNIRNVQDNGLGSLDIELEHPEMGWIPFTASPEDPVEYGRTLYERALDLLNQPHQTER